jgi:DNA-binding NarL/FixJ family response regulator
MPDDRPRRNTVDLGKKQSNVTDRDIRLLRLIADGLSGGQIAAREGLTVKGVEFNKTKLYRTIGVTNAIGATRYAIRNGYVNA